MKHVLTGLDRFRTGYWKKLKGCRLGLLANQASCDSRLDTTRDVISKLLPGQLKALFGPQHGYGGEDQDNMIETTHSADRTLGIPVFSLYADKREPLPHMLEMIDMLIIDLQDVGTRVYTFASTMLNCLKAAARNNRKVLVLDRPNPLGGKTVEGPLLKPQLYSFVGPYSLPMRHGLTMGEMARIFNHVFELGCDLEVLSVEGWRRDMLWDKTGLKWHMPSPNMPFFETALVYPGQVLLEGTNLSEGRGTCRPFEIFGAPYLDTNSIKMALAPEAIAGCHLQDYTFRPTFNKWKGELCRGFMIHITDPQVYRSCYMTTDLLRVIVEIHGESFRWKKPPYEYEYKKTPIDIIVGDLSFRRDLESGIPVSSMAEKWLSDLESYKQWRAPFLLYS
jgi:uncharacterized protein YbbC (DUF1343 family)